MPKERSDQVRQLLDSAQGAQSQPLHLVLGLDELAADASLDKRPDLLVGVELGRVRRQEKQLQLTALAFDVLLHHGGLVHRMSIDHHEHRIRCAHHQALQESLEDRGGDGAVVQHETELALGAHRRKHIEREAPAGGRHHGRLSRRCPGRARVVVRADARLVGKEHRRTLLSGLLLDGGKLLGLSLSHPFGVLLPGPVQRLLHRDTQQRHDAADRGQGRGVVELAPDQLAQDRQRPQSNLEAVLQRRLVGDGLGQRLHLGPVELGWPTRNRLGLERLLAALVVVGQPAKDRAAMHAVGQCQVGRPHAGLGRLDGTQAHCFERGMVKLAGVGLLVGSHPMILRKWLYFRKF